MVAVHPRFVVVFAESLSPFFRDWKTDALRSGATASLVVNILTYISPMEQPGTAVISGQIVSTFLGTWTPVLKCYDPYPLQHRYVESRRANRNSSQSAQLIQHSSIPCTVIEVDADRYARTQGGTLDIHELSVQLALKEAGLRLKELSYGLCCSTRLQRIV